MNSKGKLSYKSELKNFCRAIIELRINAAKAAINDAQEAANYEEKSSAGDKYETSRAMSHIEKDMHSRQVSENMKELTLLNSVNTDMIYSTATTGAVIDCGAVRFFIAIGLGKRIFNKEIMFFLSSNAALAKLLLNKKAGDGFTFNGATFIIADIF